MGINYRLGPYFAAGVAAECIVGFVIRIWSAVRLPRLAFISDAQYYHLQANLIASGQGFVDPFVWATTGRSVPVATHPPLFSAVLSMGSWLGFSTELEHRIVAGSIGVVTIVALGLIGRRIGGVATGLMAAGIAAIYPNFWGLEASLMSEGLAVALASLALLMALRCLESSRVIDHLMLGIIIGLASLTRAEMVLLAPLFAVVFLSHRALPRSTRGVRQVIGLFLAVVVVVAPWAIRNSLALSRPVVFSTSGETVLAVANCNPTYYVPQTLGYWTPGCNGNLGERDDARRSALERQRGVEYAKSHLNRLLTVVVWARIGRVLDIYRPFENARYAGQEGRGLAFAQAGLLAYWACVALGAVGAVALWRRSRPVCQLLLVPLVAVVVTAVYAFGAVRFRSVAEPSLVVVAAIGAQVIVRSLVGGTRRSAVIGR